MDRAAFPEAGLPPAAEPSGDEERKYRAPALEKGLDILELMARRATPMTLSQISAALDRSVSELFRMVQALEYKGYLEATGEGYSLTNRLFSLGMAQAPTKTLLEAAMPVMRRLAKSSGQSCHLAVMSDDQIVAIARVEAPGEIGLSVRVGYRRPLIETTSGVVLFTFQPEAQRNAWLERFAGAASAEVQARFSERVAQVEKQGYARLPSDFAQGVIDLSAPVEGAYRAVAALTVPYFARSPNQASIDETLTLLRASAQEISLDLRADD